MEDDLDAADGVVHALVAAQLTLDHLDVVVESRQVGAVAGGEVVEDTHRIAPLEQAADEVGANEAAAARYEHLAAHQATPARTW